MFGFGLGLCGVAALAASGVSQPQISVTAGGGYAGSVYSCTIGGQWSADGKAIAGATGNSWVMTQKFEGAAIRCGASNIIQMWLPSDLPAGLAQVWLDPKRDVTVASGRVVSLPDQIGQRHFAQGTASAQPAYTDESGYPAVHFTNNSTNRGLAAPDNFVAPYQFYVAQYMSGAEAATPSGNATLVSDGTLTNIARIHTASWGYGALSAQNGSDAFFPVVLPLPKSIVALRPANTGAAVNWVLGRGASAMHSWVGYVFEVLMLSADPSQTHKQMIEGFLAHRNGIASLLPENHPFKTLGPRIA
ncbi:hypothetical protein BVG79_01313 [Ketogulonicigenium robustum]|uniref:Uncharacterized protein n=1 Tax=Ketogulonicigenium robustum TaxID=92947 RepID=A0A1W6NZP3_9RHOB|nr:hypothetical protein [Ketogulonicigenium robustum]ARO14659.1 hypothetical protein BVG79_01313 [Ketogulonicigenium robustum]